MRLHLILLLATVLALGVVSCNGGGGNNSPTAPTYPAGKPTGVTASPGSQSATINWNAISGAAGYYVYMSTDGVKFSRVPGGLILSTKFTVLDLTNGRTYYFGVSAVGVGGWETAIAYAGGTPGALPIVPKLTPHEEPNEELGVPPAPPENLQGIAKDAAVLIWWDENTETDFSHYRVYYRRVDQGGSFQVLLDDLAFAPTIGNPLRITDLSNSGQYEFYVTAVDIEATPHESDPSNQVILTPQNFPPEKLKNFALFVNPGRVTLQWDIPDEADIKSYAVERVEGVDTSTGAEIIARFEIDKPADAIPDEYAGGLIVAWVDVDAGTIFLQDTALVIGQQYTYRVAAIDISGQEGAVVEETMPTPVI